MAERPFRTWQASTSDQHGVRELEKAHNREVPVRAACQQSLSISLYILESKGYHQQQDVLKLCAPVRPAAVSPEA